MSAAIAVLCLAAAGLLGFLALECLLGCAGKTVDAALPDAPPFTVLMPAHDEACGIALSVRAVMAQLRPGDRLVVVADNCSDDTAEIARSLGATVLERSDPDLRGKGHALEFGRAFLEAPEPEGTGDDVVIIVDADCIPQPLALVRLAATTAARGAVVQGAYLMMPGANASAKVHISCFAFMVKNLVRQRALDRLAGVALLQGSGMGFPRMVFDRTEWRSASLVEDLDMGLDLVLAGNRVVFDGSAVFLSDASSQAGTAGQRRRWEHGMMHAMARYVPALLHKALTGRSRLAFVALDLMIPPTAMLIAASAIVLAAGLGVLGLTFPTWALVFAVLLLGMGLARGWHVHGRQILPSQAIGAIPGYILWKLPIAARFIMRREKDWIRTERKS